MEPIVSQKILLPIIPWFLENYKPWTVKDAVVQHLYMGRSPLVFTEMRVLHQTTDDDHLVLIGVKFLRHWPFLGRLRVCFVEPPYFQMTVKPIFTHGLHVTELPGIAGWLDKLLAVAFEQTLVEGPQSEEMSAASRLEEDVSFYQTSSPEVAKVFHIDPRAKCPALVLLKKETEKISHSGLLVHDIQNLDYC